MSEELRARRLPARIAHADWGTAAAKCVVATAELRDGVYRARAPTIVGRRGGLLERMHLTDGQGASTLIGFDFPIGVPRAYGCAVGIERFADWFRTLDLGSALFEVAADLADVAPGRPFFPSGISTKSPGLKRRFHDALGLSGEELLRRCDRAHCGRRAASEMFWALGPQAVGKATLSGWRTTLRPALAERGRRYSIWPFDGPFSELLELSSALIVEAYPAEMCHRLGLRMGTPGSAKTRQRDRRADARRLLCWCAENAVVPDSELTAKIADGFGPSRCGEDAFDAVVGLFGMIDTVLAEPQPELPDDPEVTRLEGWILGRHPTCPLGAERRVDAVATGPRPHPDRQILSPGA